MEKSQPLGHRGRCLEVRKRPRTAPEQRRREVQEQLVDEAGGEQRPGEPGAALDEQLVHSAGREQR